MRTQSPPPCRDVAEALMPVESAEDVRQLKSILQQHLKMTGSDVARKILLNWDRERAAFVKVFPLEYRCVGSGLVGRGCPRGKEGVERGS